MNRKLKIALLTALPTISLASSCICLTSCNKNDDTFQGRDAYIVHYDAEHKVIKHWFTDLNKSNICCDVSEDFHPDIIADDGTKWARGEFNFQLHLNPELEEIPGYFLDGCKKYNKDINLFDTQIKKIGPNFLKNCAAFNSAIAFPKTLIELSGYFLDNCTEFNKYIDFNGIPLEKIGGYFLRGCAKFDNGGQKLIIPKSVYQCGGNFLRECVSFNQELDISCEISVIEENFLNKCSSFNKPIDLSGCTKLEKIDAGFMKDCENFDNEINLSKCTNLAIIGSSFLMGCKKYSGGLDLSELDGSKIKISIGFLCNCDGITPSKPINLGNIPAGSIDIRSSGAAFVGCGFTTTNQGAVTRTNGVKIIGDHAADLIALIKERDETGLPEGFYGWTYVN